MTAEVITHPPLNHADQYSFIHIILCVKLRQRVWRNESAAVLRERISDQLVPPVFSS